LFLGSTNIAYVNSTKTAISG